MGKKKETEGVREQRWVGYGSSLSSVNGISSPSRGGGGGSHSPRSFHDGVSQVDIVLLLTTGHITHPPFVPLSLLMV